jgi:translation initiation factor 2B subunit (eIF-2B alpha/beta/delta family)
MSVRMGWMPVCAAAHAKKSSFVVCFGIVHYHALYVLSPMIFEQYWDIGIIYLIMVLYRDHRIAK